VDGTLIADQVDSAAPVTAEIALADTFKKSDAGKPTFDLLPWDALASVSRVLEHGAEKYGAGNWEKGTDWLRYWNATLRHLTSWLRGEDKDPETGESHLAHAVASILILLAMSQRGLGKDNRGRS
jgi:hypothetical protein